MNAMLAVFGLGGGELVVVMVAILILFGARRIPEFAKGLGQGIREFKKASNEVTTEFHQAMETPPAPRTPVQTQAPVATAAHSAPSETVPKA